MPDAPGSAAAASVLFLNVPGLAKRPVAEQARVKGRLEALVERAIAPLAAPDRIVADQVDGIAVAVLGSPVDALQAARRARRLAARARRESLPLRVSLSHGLLRVAPDDHGELWLAGDAIAAGASISGFAEPGRILASRSFRDALEPVDPERAACLRPAGTVTGAALRAHELYAFEPSSTDLGVTLGGSGRRRRRLLLIGTLSVVGILAAGFAARAARKPAPPPQERPSAVRRAWNDFRKRLPF